VQNLPIVDALVKIYNGTEFQGQFMVDTGARTDVIVSSPSVVKYDLAENVGKYYTLRASIGTSTRRTKMRYGRLASFEVAGEAFDDIPVALSSDNKGVLAMDFIDGLIGNRLLQRFNMIFDYEHAKLYLEPGPSFNTAYSINLTGFSLSFKDAQPIIKNLIERSPADKAGLRNNDQIISINTVLVENMTTDEIRQAFEKEGETIALVIKRNNKLKYTEFQPKPMI
jgi:C-terminal processing protease CtpA/Prc